jgi:hypothetical protein
MQNDPIEGHQDSHDDVPEHCTCLLGPLPTGFAHFVFFRQSFFGNVLVPTRGTPKFGCEGLCRQGIDKIRFLVFGFRQTLTRTVSSRTLDCRLTTTVMTRLLLLIDLV